MRLANCAGCCLVGSVVSGKIVSTLPQCYDGTQDAFCGSGAGLCERCSPVMNGIRGAACQDCSEGGLCIGAQTTDGGLDYLCGYDCLTPVAPSCGTFCSSPSNCFTPEQFFNTGP